MVVVEGMNGTVMKINEIQVRKTKEEALIEINLILNIVMSQEGEKISHQFHLQSRHYPVNLKLLNRNSETLSSTTDEQRQVSFFALDDI